MIIVIPTRGRVGKQTTLQNLPGELWPDVMILCPSGEVAAHQKDFPYVKVQAQEDDNWDIATKRKWIVEHSADPKLVMLDDDLRFAYRRKDETDKFRTATDKEILQGFIELENYLCEDFPHAGFTARGGSINPAARKGGWQIGKRMMYVLGYYLPVVCREAEFGRVSTHEDIDVCLQLLKKDLPNIVNFDLVVDQKFGNPGGCTDERTVESNNRDVIKLAELHPGLVRVTEKKYTSSTPRLEVVCSWQKAWLDG